MAVRIHAVDHPELAPFEMPERFRHDVTYFCTSPGEPGAPDSLGEGEYFVRREDAQRFYDDGVITIVSPLDSEARTDLELTEDQERWLEWMLDHDVQHVRIG